MSEEAIMRTKYVLLIGGLVIGRLALLQRSRSTAVKEAHYGRCIVVVGRDKTSTEVGEEIDRCAIEIAFVQDSWYHDTHVRLSVVTYEGGIDHER